MCGIIRNGLVLIVIRTWKRENVEYCIKTEGYYNQKLYYKILLRWSWQDFLAFSLAKATQMLSVALPSVSFRRAFACKFMELKFKQRAGPHQLIYSRIRSKTSINPSYTSVAYFPPPPTSTHEFWPQIASELTLPTGQNRPGQ